jgi:predicted transcriptional regulator
MPAPDRILALTAEIVAAWAAANNAGPTMVAGLIRDIHQTLAGLALGSGEAPGQTGSRRPPAVAPRKSVFADHVVCLECGREMTSLRRHLMDAHGLTPEFYRLKWRLAPKHPIVAPDYAKLRSAMAKASGLGRRDKPARRRRTH